MDTDDLGYIVYTSRTHGQIAYITNANELSDYDCYYDFGINFYDNPDCDLNPEILVARMNGHIYDLSRITNLRYDPVDVADCENSDESDAMYALYKSRVLDKYDKRIDDNWALSEQHHCYIDYFSVEEKYRHQGIGKYIFNKLPTLLRYSLNVNVRCSMILVADVGYRGVTEDSRLIMIDCLKKSGYKKIADDGKLIYAKNEMLRPYEI